MYTFIIILIVIFVILKLFQFHADFYFKAGYRQAMFLPDNTVKFFLQRGMIQVIEHRATWKQKCFIHGFHKGALERKLTGTGRRTL